MQFVDLVLHECSIRIYIPCEVLVLQDCVGQVDFQTRVSHRTYVHRDFRITIDWSNRLEVQHVARLTAEVFDRTVQTVAQQSEVNTHVVGSRSFPCQIWVTLVVQLTIREYAVSTSHLELVCICIVICTAAT